MHRPVPPVEAPAGPLTEFRLSVKAQLNSRHFAASDLTLQRRGSAGQFRPLNFRCHRIRSAYVAEFAAHDRR